MRGGAKEDRAMLGELFFEFEVDDQGKTHSRAWEWK